MYGSGDDNLPDLVVQQALQFLQGAARRLHNFNLLLYFRSNRSHQLDGPRTTHSHVCPQQNVHIVPAERRVCGRPHLAPLPTSQRFNTVPMPAAMVINFLDIAWLDVPDAASLPHDERPDDVWKSFSVFLRSIPAFN